MVTLMVYMASYLIVWSAGFLCALAVKARLKQIDAELHAKLVSPSLMGHSMGFSLCYIRFAMNSSRWAELDDGKLIRLLKLQRLLFLAVLLGIVGFMITIVFLPAS